jgi:hypothetical protein
VQNAQVTYLPSTIQPPVPAPLPPRRPLWSPLILTQLVVVLAVLLSGVVGAGVLRGRHGGTDVLSLVQAASTTAESASSYRATINMHMALGGNDVDVTGEVLSDLAGHRSGGFVEVPGLGRMSVVQIGGRAFFQLPNGRVDPAGHHWLAVNAPRGDAQSAVGGQDPAAFFKMLADPEDVKAVGEETVNGTKATHYRVKPDPQRLADAGSKALGTSLPPTATDGLKNLHIDVWIDDDNRVRRMQMQLKQDAVAMTMTMNVLDFDQPVTVTEPPATDVSELPNLGALGPAIVGGRAG